MGILNSKQQSVVWYKPRDKSDQGLVRPRRGLGMLLRHAFLRLFIKILWLWGSQAYARVRKGVMGAAWTFEGLRWENSCWGLYFEDTPSLDSSSSLSPLSQSVPDEVTGRRSVWVHHYFLQGMCNHKCRQCILWIYMVKKKKKKRLIKRKCWSKVRRTIWCWKAAEEPPREGDQESCLDFVSKWFHPRLMVSEWSQILNLIFF